MLVKTGFRGMPVNILENNGFIYANTPLPFDKEAKRYSFTNRRKFTTDYDEEDENMPYFIRNQVVFTIDADNGDEMFLVELQNVNKYNLQPCRIRITASALYRQTPAARGCMVNRKYAPVCSIPDIKYLDSIPEPSQEDLKNLPALETPPILKNIQFQ